MKPPTFTHNLIAVAIYTAAVATLAVYCADAEVVVLLSVILAIGVIAYLYTK